MEGTCWKTVTLAKELFANVTIMKLRPSNRYDSLSSPSCQPLKRQKKLVVNREDFEGSVEILICRWSPKFVGVNPHYFQFRDYVEVIVILCL